MGLNTCPPSFKIVKLGDADAERNAINAGFQAILRCMSGGSIPSPTGHTGQYLTNDGTAIFWATVPAGTGTVTSVGISTGSSGVAVTSSPISSSGTINLALGTMAAKNDAPSDGIIYGRLNGSWVDTAGVFQNSQSIRKDFHSVSAGSKLRAYVPNDWTLKGVSILANTPGSLVVDIWKDVYGSYPPLVGDSICAAAKPTLSSTDKYLNSTLTGWNKNLGSGDTLVFNVDSVTTITDFELTLFGTAGYALLLVTGAFTATTIGSPLAGSPLAITGGLAPYSLSGSPYSGTRPAGVTISISGSTVVATGNTTTAATYTWTERVLSTDGQHFDVACSVVTAIAVHGFAPSISPSSYSFSSSDSVAQKTTDNNFGAVSKTTITTQDVYAEFLWGSVQISPFGTVGISDVALNATTEQLGGLHSWVYYQQTGQTFHNGNALSYGVSSGANDTIQVWFKGSTGELYFGKNDTVMNSGNPVTGSNPAFTGLSSTFRLCASTWRGSSPTSVITLVPVGSHLYSPRTGFTAID